MLQIKGVHPKTFQLLKDLSSAGNLRDFALAGGTSLALQLGHRISVDLDFFTQSTFDSSALFESLRSSYDISSCSKSTNSLSLFIKFQNEEIRVDFIRHNYPYLSPLRIVEEIRLFSLADIAAMKLNAIANRGAKKDFYDIHALLGVFSFQEILHYFEKKYEQLNSFTVVKSIVYFADADIEPDPVSLEEISWDEIKLKLQGLVSKGIS